MRNCGPTLTLASALFLGMSLSLPAQAPHRGIADHFMAMPSAFFFVERWFDADSPEEPPVLHRENMAKSVRTDFLTARNQCDMPGCIIGRIVDHRNGFIQWSTRGLGGPPLTTTMALFKGAGSEFVAVSNDRLAFGETVGFRFQIYTLDRNRHYVDKTSELLPPLKIAFFAPHKKALLALNQRPHIRDQFFFTFSLPQHGTELRAYCVPSRRHLNTDELDFLREFCGEGSYRPYLLLSWEATKNRFLISRLVVPGTATSHNNM
jgi:hypothetical protein